MADPYVRPGDRLLDVGCHDGAFIARVRPRLASAIGIDPLADPSQDATVTILRGALPDVASRLDRERFDCVTVLATLEHVDDPAGVVRACFRLLAPGGRLVVTVPHPLAHRLVTALIRLRMADGMGLDLGGRFDRRTVEPMLASAGFRLRVKRSFELGLNRLYVCDKPSAPG